jgi:hypothetical protein
MRASTSLPGTSTPPRTGCDASATAKRAVSLSMVARTLANPQGVVQRQIGPHYNERWTQEQATSPMRLWPGDLDILGIGTAEQGADAAGFTGSIGMKPPATRYARTRGYAPW